MYLMETLITREEVQLKESIQKMLLHSIFEFNVVEVPEEFSLDFLDQFKECEVEAVEEDDNDENCSQRDKDLDVDYKRRAVVFWNGGGKKRKLNTVQHDFKYVSSERQLRRWAHQIEAGGTKRERLAQISEYVIQNLREAIDAGYILHDRDIRRWALKAYKEQGNDNMVFKASRKWVNNFKKAHHIVSRKITKFVTRTTIEDDEVLKVRATDFVKEVFECQNRT